MQLAVEGRLGSDCEAFSLLMHTTVYFVTFQILFFSVNLCALLLLRHELSSGSSNSRVTLLQLYDTNMSSDPSNFRAYDYETTAVATTGADDVDDDDDDDEGE